MRAIIEDPADLGRVIRRLRLRNEMTQQQLADALGATQRYVSELETGKPKIADERYFRLLRLLGMRLTVEIEDGRDAD